MKIDFKDNSIVVVKDSYKENFIRELRKSGKLLDIKIMGLAEFKKKFYFDYGLEAVYYVHQKYGCIKDLAKIYLENIYYIKDDVNDEKVDFLKGLKEDLDDHKLLTYTPSFKDFLRTKEVVLYNLKYIDKFYENMFEEVASLTTVTHLDVGEESTKKPLYELPRRDMEIFFVAGEIAKLIKRGIPINRIKIANAKDAYLFPLRRIFKDYNMPLEFSSSATIKSTLIYKAFKDNFTVDLEVALKKTEEFVKSDEDKEVYSAMIDVLNEYTWATDYSSVRDFILDDLAKIKKRATTYSDSVKLIDFLATPTSEEDYIFLLNFNQGILPVDAKDEDFLNDEVKRQLGLSDSIDLNKKAIMEIREKIARTKNLVVTYSKKDLGGELYISNAFSEELFEKSIPTYDFTSSDAYNKKLLLIEKDENKKYGTTSEIFKRLITHYPAEPFETYDNSFKGIDPTSLKEHMNDKLTLSYSSMNTFYKCSFRYYLDNILKVNKFEDTFEQVVGTIFHEVLARAFEPDFDFDTEWSSAIARQNYDYKNMENFFLGFLKDELLFIIESIERQYESTYLDRALYEQRIEITVDEDKNVVFKGFVDKILYGDFDEGRTVSIIDYKTGHPELSLDNCIYGLEMQLPIYSYLIKHMDGFENAHIGGFYLQKILNNFQDPQEKYNALKLQGYSNSDTMVLSKVDKDYANSNTIKSLKMGKDGFYAYSKVLSDANIERLNSIVEEKIKSSADEILKGNFTINPKQIGNDLKGCEFCKYKDICFLQAKEIVQLAKADKKDFLGGEENARLD